MVDSTIPVESLTTAERVITAVAEATDVSPTELSPPLYDVVDPDALESLVEQAPDDGVRISFEFHECTVIVSGNGDVSVSPTDLETNQVTVLSMEDCPDAGTSAL
jgi:hypothetical protein